MKFISYVENFSQLEQARELGLEQVILSSKELSRFGRLSETEMINLIHRAKELDIDVIVEWDILMTESVFQQKCLQVEKLFKLPIKAFRLQDPGAIHFLKTKSTIPIQLNLENGNHNYLSVKKWVDFVGDQLDRVILSIELSRDTLASYIEKLPCQVEFLGLGRILLFYTPRNLLDPLISEKREMSSSEFLEVQASSEESPHKGFPVLQNQHGTFMFHIKEFFLLDYISDLKKIGLDYLRLDLRFSKSFEILASIIELAESQDPGELLKLKDSLGTATMRGFYHVNKTDVLFKKLKNNRLQRKDDSYLGEVSESLKNQYIAISVKAKSPLKVGEKLLAITPEGKEKRISVKSLFNASNQKTDQVQKNQLAIISYCSGVPVRSALYRTLTSPLPHG